MEDTQKYGKLMNILSAFTADSYPDVRFLSPYLEVEEKLLAPISNFFLVVCPWPRSWFSATLTTSICACQTTTKNTSGAESGVNLRRNDLQKRCFNAEMF